MVTALAVLIVSPKPVAWVLFVAGWALIAFPFWQNWRYGRYRPDQHQINAMSGDEYKRHFHDPKFRKWVERQARKHPTTCPTSRVEGDGK